MKGSVSLDLKRIAFASFMFERTDPRSNFFKVFICSARARTAVIATLVAP
jgi:hypothetical protein